jgi:RNA polymerase sigma-70 factor (ECF subfamily)
MVDDAPSPGDDLRVDAGQSELVRRAQSGDTAAFGQLYRLHAGRVYALCLRLEADAARADELTQDVFVRAWERLTSFRGESAFGTWLHRLAVNLMLEHRAGLGRDRKRWSSDEAAITDQPGRRHTIDESLDMDDAVRQLPDGMRQIFVLYDVEGYQHDEIGKMLGISTGTSKSQLHRARMALRQLLLR